MNAKQVGQEYNALSLSLSAKGTLEGVLEQRSFFPAQGRYVCDPPKAIVLPKENSTRVGHRKT